MNGIEEREVAEIAKFTPGELKEYEDNLHLHLMKGVFISLTPPQLRE